MKLAKETKIVRGGKGSVAMSVGRSKTVSHDILPELAFYLKLISCARIDEKGKTTCLTKRPHRLYDSNAKNNPLEHVH